MRQLDYLSVPAGPVVTNPKATVGPASTGAERTAPDERARASATDVPPRSGWSEWVGGGMRTGGSIPPPSHFWGVPPPRIVSISSWVSGAQGDESGLALAASGLSPCVHHLASNGTPSKSTRAPLSYGVSPDQVG